MSPISGCFLNGKSIDEPHQDQWKKKKQTKEQAAAARRAKLDPDSAKTAKDVMDERVRKRKLEELEEQEESEIEGVEKEQPKQGMKQPQEKKTKKQKVEQKSGETETSKSAEAKVANATEKSRLKQEWKKEKKENKLKKAEQKKEKAQGSDTKSAKAPTTKDNTSSIEEVSAEDRVDATAGEVEEDIAGGEKIDFEADGLEGEALASTVSPSPTPTSPTFDNPAQENSTSTSTSSVIPPATAPKHIKLTTDPELLRARLAARIEALRAARKADGPDGAPARNRQELLESRRKKEEQRRAHKKELRLKAKVEEDARREAALASARDSPASSMMSPSIQSPPHNFSFGRVSFADGQQLADDMTSTRDAPKKRGPKDAASALAATEKKRLRLAGLDDEKRADIEEKDLWLNAKKKAHGEKVRDDASLLKKTLRRKDKMKAKSATEWNARKEGVAKSQAMKQKKREENLKKRRDEKGVKGKKVKSKKTKAKSRPGFEGSFGSSKRK
jgi:hypothetical protein